VAYSERVSARSHTTWTARDWTDFLRERLGHDVEVRFGRSRSVPVQCRWAEVAMPRRRAFSPPCLQVRMHLMFAQAPEEVREAAASWIRSGRRAPRACRKLDGFIEEGLRALPPAPSRALKVTPRGRHHDLVLLAAPLWEGDFRKDFGESRSRPRLTWGRSVRSRSRRSLRLGSYVPESHLIRVHPVLDQAAVPAWYLRCVLHHEILHAVLPPVRTGAGRWVHHGPDFREREAAYPEYERAVAWEEKHLPRLIRSARTGRPLPVGSEAQERARNTGISVMRSVQRLLF
jgi:hypothetical protein